mmetsp:Transcript_7755/g.14663  ORF Transcript_7755/g.14663 Transcript_7755/m.14663 type:complete len:85 (+) Transcript_7755:262-516(+)
MHVGASSISTLPSLPTLKGHGMEVLIAESRRALVFQRKNDTKRSFSNFELPVLSTHTTADRAPSDTSSSSSSSSLLGSARVGGM